MRAFVTMLFVAAVATGQAPKAPSPSPAERLKPMAFLVGTWTRDAEAGKPSESFEVAPMYDGNFLRMKTTFRTGDKVVWTDETTYGWDEEANKVFGMTLGQDGSIGRVASTGELKDGAIAFEGSRSTNGVPVKLRAALDRIDADTLKATIEVFKDGAYRTVKSAIYKRQKSG